MTVEELGAYFSENGENIKEQLRTRKYTVHQISFLTQRILLQGLYEGYDHDTVSKLAEHLDVSKMAITLIASLQS